MQYSLSRDLLGGKVQLTLSYFQKKKELIERLQISHEHIFYVCKNYTQGK